MWIFLQLYLQVHVNDYVVVKNIVVPHGIIVLQLKLISWLDGFYTNIKISKKCIFNHSKLGNNQITFILATFGE